MLLLVLLAAVGTALPAAAQNDWQIYGGTSFLWVKNDSTTLQSVNLGTLNEWGWQTDITEYPWRWFGGTVESSGFYARPSFYDPTNQQSYGNLLNVKSYTMMFGPSFAYRRNPYFEPFGHILAGAVNEQCTLIHSYDACRLFNGESGGYSQWIFGWSLGGGADIRLSRLIAIRGQMDWLPTTFKNLYNDRQNNYRVSVGLVFRFGGTERKTTRLKPADQTPSAQPPGEQSNNSMPAGQNVVPPKDVTPIAAATQVSRSSPAPSAAKAQAPSSVPVASSQAVSASQPSAPQDDTKPLAQRKAEASHLQPGGGTAPEATVASAAPSSPSSPVANATPVNAGAVPAVAAPASNPSPSANAAPVNAGAAPAPAAPSRPAAEVTSAAPSPAPATPAMVEFWSSPTGADIQIDGQYVGSTYSIIAVPPGEHTITITKEDFAKWERTILVGEGTIRVAAYLERVRATVTFH